MSPTTTVEASRTAEAFGHRDSTLPNGRWEGCQGWRVCSYGPAWAQVLCCHSPADSGRAPEHARATASPPTCGITSSCNHHLWIAQFATGRVPHHGEDVANDRPLPSSTPCPRNLPRFCSLPDPDGTFT